MKKLLFLLLFPISLWAQEVDFTKLYLHVNFDTIKEDVIGDVRLHFTCVDCPDTVFLDGIKMDYHKVMLNEKEVSYRTNDTGIFIPLSGEIRDTHQIDIGYRCHPKKGIYFIGWDDEKGISRRQIWTQGQGIDHRHWIPHFDDQTDKVQVDLRICFNTDYEVMANGVLQGSPEIKKGVKHWDYHMKKPMSSYLIAIVIGKYGIKNTFGVDSIPLMQYYYPDRASDFDIYYAHNEEIYNFMVDEIGVPYPWQNYKQAPVQDFRHGAMENTTATIFGDFFCVDEAATNDRNYTYVNAHELAHQWFGNLVTATGSKHHWLHEGFATYYQWLSEKNLYGKDYYDWERKKAADLVFQASARDSFPLSHPKAGSERFYQKGAWVLHMLHQKLGDSTFKKVITTYLEKHAFGVVTTEDFLKVVNTISGKDYRDFFNHWVLTKGEASIKAILAESKNGKSYGIFIEQDSGTCFCGNYQVRVAYKSGAEKLIPMYWNNEPLHMYDADYPSFGPKFTEFIELDKSPDEILYWTIDPEKDILVKLKESKPFEMWQAQYRLSTGLLDKYAAVEGLRQIGFKEKKKFLLEIVEDANAFFSLRAEALRQLLEENYTSYTDALVLALSSTDVQLQKEAITLVQAKTPELEKAIAALRFGSSYELREWAISKGINGNDRAANKWLYDTRYNEEPGIPGNKVLITALAYRILLYRDEAAADQLVAFSYKGYDFMTKMNAFQTMEAIGLVNSEVIENLFDALFDPNWKIRSTARNMLQNSYEKENIKEQIDAYMIKMEPLWEDFQNTAARRTFGLDQSE